MDVLNMDIWDKLYSAAKGLYHPQYSSPFIYSHHVVCALESISGEIYTGVCLRSCCGVGNLCAERVAALTMFNLTGETRIKRILTFRDSEPEGDLCVPCGACREFIMQLSTENADTEIMISFSRRKIIKLGSLEPHWWGYAKINENNKC